MSPSTAGLHRATSSERSAHGTIKTAQGVAVRCSAGRSLNDFHQTADPSPTAVARSSSNLVLDDPAKHTGYWPVTVRQMPITAHDTKPVSAGQRLFAIKCQLVPLSVATKETKKS
ncbi:MAG: hypothetical protein ACOYD0_12635 [Candidatus Nanopelagicales bacterium]